MPRVKKVTGRFGMEVTYDVTETVTHKTTLENGTVLRSDMNGLYMSEKDGKITSAWKGNKEFVWLFPTKDTAQVADLVWVEEDFSREYEMEVDMS